jgi:hypothetical protein
MFLNKRICKQAFTTLGLLLKAVFSVWSMKSSYRGDNWGGTIEWVPRVEAGSNTSTVALRVVGGDEKGTQWKPSAWGYNWVTLFLGDINTGTWPSRLGESRIWDSKIWSRVPRDSDQRMIALARTSSNCKRQTRSLVRENAPHQQTRNCLTVIKIWS